LRSNSLNPVGFPIGLNFVGKRVDLLVGWF
jgi:hypothetical protein